YELYAAALPPLARKDAQSYQCGDQKGTLYYFEYSSDAEREQALRFAHPVLGKDWGQGGKALLVSRPNSFILVSFRQPPAELLEALGASAGVAATPAPEPSAPSVTAPPSNALAPAPGTAPAIAPDAERNDSAQATVPL